MTRCSPKAIKSRPPANQQGQKDSGAPRPDAERIKSFCGLALLAAVLLAPFAAMLLAPHGRALGNPQCDAPKAYYHYGYFLGQCWRNGVMPLWNPHIMLGIPFLGEGQSSAFHPLSFLYAFLKTNVAMNWLIALSFLATGLFFYGYLRALGLGRPASWCGAITWSFSSAMISRIFTGHLNILLAFISIPMIMMFWERYRATENVRQLAGITIGYGLMILAFYPQVQYIFSLFFLFYVLIQSGTGILDQSSTLRREGRSIFRLGLSILLGIGVGAIQLLPSLDFVAQSFRQEATIEFCGTFSFAPENLLTLIAPKFFGSDLGLTPTRYWGRNLLWEMWIYLGILPLLLAVAGAWAAPKRQRLALLMCAGLFLVLGLGKHTFLFPIMYEHVPFFDVFRGASKNTLVTLFCLVTLSAYGFEGLFGAKESAVPEAAANNRVPLASIATRRQLQRVAVSAGVLLLLVISAVGFSLLRNAAAPNSDWEQFIKAVWKTGERHVVPLTENMREIVPATAHGAIHALTRASVLIVLSLVLILTRFPARWRKYAFLPPNILVLVDLVGFSAPLLVTFDQSITQLPLTMEESAKPPYLPRILVPFNPMPNTAMHSGYSSVFGYTGNTLKRYNEFISHLQNLDPHEAHAESRFVQFSPQFGMLRFDAVAFLPQDLPKTAKPIGHLGDRILVPFYDSGKAPKPAFLAPTPRYFSDSDSVLPYIFSPHSDVFSRPAIERQDQHLDAHPLDAEEDVRFVSFTLNRVELNVKAKWPRELILTGMYEKNWQAEVNGVPARVEPANYVFRAVQVPEGTSRVVFQYRPRPFYAGAIVSGVSLLGLFLILAFFRFKTRPAMPYC